MQIEVQAQGFYLTDELKRQVAAKLRIALGRVEDKVREVRVKLSEARGPARSTDTRCYVQVRMKQLPNLIIQERRVQLEAAIGSAAERLRRTVSWAVVGRRSPARLRMAAAQSRAPSRLALGSEERAFQRRATLTVGSAT